jgi:hypothetical protein
MPNAVRYVLMASEYWREKVNASPRPTNAVMLRGCNLQDFADKRTMAFG